MQIETNPLTKTYDELQRSQKRMERYLEMFRFKLDEQEIKDSKEIIEGLKNACTLVQDTIDLIPENLKLTKHYYREQKKQREKN